MFRDPSFSYSQFESQMLKSFAAGLLLAAWSVPDNVAATRQDLAALSQLHSQLLPGGVAEVQLAAAGDGRVGDV